jgi:LysM repeat protein
MESSRRNLKTEIIVALAALSMLAVGVIFAIVLTAETLRKAVESSATAVAPPAGSLASTEAPTVIAAVSATAESSPTDTPASPETSPTRQATAVQDTPTPAETESRGTDTPTPSATATATPGASATPKTGLPPSPSATDTPTASPTATLPSPTIPTATEAMSDTPGAPSPTATILLSTPITPSPPAESATPAACAPPDGWRPYTVQSGDNLFRISLRAGVSLSRMQEANCIANPAELVAGTVIYVPADFLANQPAPATGQPTQLPPADESSIPLQTGCTIPQVTISSPRPGAILTDRFTVYGVATLSDVASFSFYKVEIRPEDQFIFRNVSQSSAPAPEPNSILATVNPADFGPGTYQLVLTVVDKTGNYPEPCAIRVIFR